MDVLSLKPGEDYNDLQEGYVIFICTFDPFGKGLLRYTFERVCLENGEPLNDGSKIIILNTKGTSNDISEELVHFLGYFENSTDEYISKIKDESIIRLHKRIVDLKKRRDLEDGYMKFEEFLNQQKRECRREETRKRIKQVLEHNGLISEEIITIIDKEINIDKLDRMFNLALEAASIEDFLKEINE